MTGELLEIAYRLRHHRLGDWGLDRWGVTLAWGAAALILLAWVFRGRPVVPPSHWTLLALLVLIGLALLGLREGGAARSYVAFTPEEGLASPVGQALDPADKILIHATGRFEVAGKTRFFANLLAYWRSFATREHAVMAIVHDTRFLVGRMPEADRGMWYIFFKPADIQQITAGQVTFGRERRPGLRVTCRHLPETSGDKKRRSRPRPTNVATYLSFKSDADRSLIWADLLADCVVQV